MYAKLQETKEESEGQLIESKEDDVTPQITVNASHSQAAPKINRPPASPNDYPLGLQTVESETVIYEAPSTASEVVHSVSGEQFVLCDGGWFDFSVTLYKRLFLLLIY
jgi:hypothetical protein